MPRGIAGTCGFGDDALVRAMTDTIAHRGPDGEGFFVGDGVHLGNRRLAIQDVPGGAQPMANEDGSVVVVYNGEIYNYPELRESGAGPRPPAARPTATPRSCPTSTRTRASTSRPGSTASSPSRCSTGPSGKLFLVRDPLGVKPLVYAVRDGQLAFGSEAKAVLASGLVGAELDEDQPAPDR